MPDTSRNFTNISSEELHSELESSEALSLAIRRTESQLGLFYQCPGLILWAKDGRQLRGKAAQKYLEEKLMRLARVKAK